MQVCRMFVHAWDDRLGKQQSVFVDNFVCRQASVQFSDIPAWFEFLNWVMRVYLFFSLFFFKYDFFSEKNIYLHDLCNADDLTVNIGTLIFKNVIKMMVNTLHSLFGDSNAHCKCCMRFDFCIS